MFKEWRKQAYCAEDWAKNLGIAAHVTLSPGALKRFAAHAKSDRRWREIKQRVALGARVMDAGCGMGQWVWFLRKNGMDSMGLDYSKEMIDALKMKMQDRTWINGKIQNIPLPDGSLDAIISWGVIEHDEEGPGSALKEFSRVLKPGGQIFVTTPLDSPQTRRSSGIQFPVTKEDGRFFQYYFSQQDMSNLLDQAGFSVELITPISRNYPVLFPGLYKIASRNRYAGALANRIMMPIVALVPAGASMVLAVGRKTVHTR